MSRRLAFPAIIPMRNATDEELAAAARDQSVAGRVPDEFGGCQSRTVRSASERARRRAASGPSSSQSRSSAARRTRAMPLRSPRCTQQSARARFQVVSGVKQAVQQRVPVARRQGVRAVEPVVEPRRIATDGPGCGPAAQRGLRAALVLSHRFAVDGHCPARAIRRVDLHPPLGHPAERELDDDLGAEQ